MKIITINDAIYTIANSWEELKLDYAGENLT